MITGTHHTFRGLFGVLITAWAISTPAPTMALGEPDGASAPAVAFPETLPGQGTPTGDALRFVLPLLMGVDDPDDATIRERFAPAFLQQLPPAAIRATARQIRAGMLGAEMPTDFELVSGTDQRLVVDLDGASVVVRTRLVVHVDEAGRIDGLFVQPAPPKAPPGGDSWDDLLEALDELPGVTNLGVYELVEGDGEDKGFGVRTIREVRADRSLALGSTFKLWVLIATAEAVEEGRLAWDQKLAIRTDRKSLPSGPMWLDEPGAEHTVAHMARRMIEVSDNTATDHLMLEVGRDRVEAVMSRVCAEPGPNLPLLTTMEMFRMKLGGDVELRDRFAAAGEDERRAMLDAPLPEANLMLAAAWLRPVAIDTIEWFATPADLARTMGELERLAREPGMEPVGEALRANPGVAIDSAAFPVVGYKGGSEPGVLNMTWSVHRRDGRVFVVTLGWNNTEAHLEMMRLIAIAQRAFALLAGE